MHRIQLLRPDATRLLLAVAAYAACESNACLAQDLVAAARAAQGATVTLRLAVSTDGESTVRANGEIEAAETSVRVCSGVVVQDRLVATTSPQDDILSARIRATLPGGAQTTGRLRAFDMFSRLALVELAGECPAAPTLSPENAQPVIGGWVVSGAAWGRQDALVSSGVLSGVQGRLEGADVPPLLQCDLRAGATSTGAGLFTAEGRLMGIVLATSPKRNQAGWTFGVPVSHVRRLLRSFAEHRNGERAEQLLLLRRQRPTLGMILKDVEERVVVDRVAPDSPAARAGLRVGDFLTAVDGVRIRSVYQAVRPVMQRQPGDKLVLQLQRGEKRWTQEVVLGGGESIAQPPGESWRSASVEVQRAPDGRVAVFEGEMGARGGKIETAPGDQGEAIELLQKALAAYQAALAAQRKQLQDTQTELRAANAELERLRKQSTDSPNAPAPKTKR